MKRNYSYPIAGFLLFVVLILSAARLLADEPQGNAGATAAGKQENVAMTAAEEEELKRKIIMAIKKCSTEKPVAKAPTPALDAVPSEEMVPIPLLESPSETH